MNISFDIDSTLMQSDQVRELAKLLSHIRRNLERGHLLLNVVMITDRASEEWEYDYNFKRLVDSFGFSMNDVYFTDGRDKVELLNASARESQSKATLIEKVLTRHAQGGGGRLNRAALQRMADASMNLFEQEEVRAGISLLPLTLASSNMRISAATLLSFLPRLAKLYNPLR